MLVFSDIVWFSESEYARMAHVQIGAVKLDPPSDTWFDSSSSVDVTVNLEGHHDNWAIGSNRSGFGTQWDDWSVNWTGKQLNPEPNTAVANSGATSFDALTVTL